MDKPTDSPSIFLARNLGRIRRAPEPSPTEPLHPLHALEGAVVDVALHRLEEIDAFLGVELEFFEQGEAMSRAALAEEDELRLAAAC